jgi:hypothetical protein
MIVMQALLAGWVHGHGYWFLDDYALLSFGAKYPLLSPELLFSPWGGHFMPGAFALAQVVARIGGMAYAPAAMMMLLGQVLVNVLLLRLLVLHFGPRPRALVPFGLVVSSIPILQSASWWAAGLNMIPALACIVLSVDHLLSWINVRRGRDLAWTLGAFGAAVLFFEKAALVAVVLVGVVFALRPEPGWRAATVATVRSGWPLLVGLAGMLAAWLTAYLHSSTSQFATPPLPQLVADTMGAGSLATSSGSLLGGWDNWNTFGLRGYSVSLSPTWLVLIGVQLVVGVVIWTSLNSPRATRLWLALGFYALLSSIALTSGRRWFLTFNVSLPRYFADLVVLFCLTLALSTIRLRSDPARHWELPSPKGTAPRVAWAVALAVCANLVVVNYTHSALGLGHAIGFSPSRPYVESAARGLAALGPAHTVLDLTVPREVLPLPPAPQDRYSWAFAPVRGGARFADVSEELLVITPQGEVGAGVLRGPSSTAGPVVCSHENNGVLAIPMEVEIFPWGHVARLEYTSTAAGTVRLRMAPGDPVPIVVRPGSNAVYAVFSGGGWVAHVDAREVPGTFCVRKLTVGSPELAGS